MSKKSSSAAAAEKEIAAAIGPVMSPPSVSTKPAPVQRQARGGKAKSSPADSAVSAAAASEEQGATQKSKKSRSSDAGSATREAAGSSSENSPASLSAAAGHDQSPSSPASAEQDDPCLSMPRLVTPRRLASKQTAMLIGVKAGAMKSQPAQAPSASSSPPDEGSPPSDSPSGGELDESFRAAVGAIKVKRAQEPPSRTDAKVAIQNFLQFKKEGGNSFDELKAAACVAAMTSKQHDGVQVDVQTDGRLLEPSSPEQMAFSEELSDTPSDLSIRHVVQTAQLVDNAGDSDSVYKSFEISEEVIVTEGALPAGSPVRPRRSMRIRFQPQRLELSCTNMVIEELSDEEELHAAVSGTLSDLSLSVLNDESPDVTYTEDGSAVVAEGSEESSGFSYASVTSGSTPSLADIVNHIRLTLSESHLGTDLTEDFDGVADDDSVSHVSGTGSEVGSSADEFFESDSGPESVNQPTAGAAVQIRRPIGVEANDALLDKFHEAWRRKQMEGGMLNIANTPPGGPEIIEIFACSEETLRKELVNLNMLGGGPACQRDRFLQFSGRYEKAELREGGKKKYRYEAVHCIQDEVGDAFLQHWMRERLGMPLWDEKSAPEWGLFTRLKTEEAEELELAYATHLFNHLTFGAAAYHDALQAAPMYPVKKRSASDADDVGASEVLVYDSDPDGPAAPAGGGGGTDPGALDLVEEDEPAAKQPKVEEEPVKPASLEVGALEALEFGVNGPEPEPEPVAEETLMSAVRRRSFSVSPTRNTSGRIDPDSAALGAASYMRADSADLIEIAKAMYHAKRLSEIRATAEKAGFYDEATVLAEAEEAVREATNEQLSAVLQDQFRGGSPPGSPEADSCDEPTTDDEMEAAEAASQRSHEVEEQKRALLAVAETLYKGGSPQRIRRALLELETLREQMGPGVADAILDNWNQETDGEAFVSTEQVLEADQPTFGVEMESFRPSEWNLKAGGETAHLQGMDLIVKEGQLIPDQDYRSIPAHLRREAERMVSELMQAGFIQKKPEKASEMAEIGDDEKDDVEADRTVQLSDVKSTDPGSTTVKSDFNMVQVVDFGVRSQNVHSAIVHDYVDRQMAQNIPELSRFGPNLFRAASQSYQQTSCWKEALWDVFQKHMDLIGGVPSEVWARYHDAAGISLLARTAKFQERLRRGIDVVLADKTISVHSLTCASVAALVVMEGDANAPISLDSSSEILMEMPASEALAPEKGPEPEPEPVSSSGSGRSPSAESAGKPTAPMASPQASPISVMSGDETLDETIAFVVGGKQVRVHLVISGPHLVGTSRALSMVIESDTPTHQDKRVLSARAAFKRVVESSSTDHDMLASNETVASQSPIWSVMLARRAITAGTGHTRMQHLGFALPDDGDLPDLQVLEATAQFLATLGITASMPVDIVTDDDVFVQSHGVLHRLLSSGGSDVDDDYVDIALSMSHSHLSAISKNFPYFDDDTTEWMFTLCPWMLMDEQTAGIQRIRYGMHMWSKFNDLYFIPELYYSLQQLRYGARKFTQREVGGSRPTTIPMDGSSMHSSSLASSHLLHMRTDEFIKHAGKALKLAGAEGKFTGSETENRVVWERGLRRLICGPVPPGLMEIHMIEIVESTLEEGPRKYFAGVLHKQSVRGCRLFDDGELSMNGSSTTEERGRTLDRYIEILNKRFPMSGTVEIAKSYWQKLELRTLSDLTEWVQIGVAARRALGNQLVH